MLTQEFLSKNWISSTEEIEKSDIVMVGIPYDGTCSFKPGSRFAPAEIRLASIGLETYSPYFDKDLDDIKFHDAGELDLPFGNRDKSLDIIYKTTKDVLNNHKKWIGIGGEHLVSLPAIKAHAEHFPNLAVIQFDAHADMRDEYLGEEKSHATVMKRVSEYVNEVYQVGIRSGTKEEFEEIKNRNSLINSLDEFKELSTKLGNKPVYLTIDLDVLDPSIISGTGTQEAGGMSFNKFISYIKEISKLNIIGADVVELAPNYDTSGVSTITAAKVIREVLMIF